MQTLLARLIKEEIFAGCFRVYIECHRRCRERRIDAAVDEPLIDSAAEDAYIRGNMNGTAR